MITIFFAFILTIFCSFWALKWAWQLFFGSIDILTRTTVGATVLILNCRSHSFGRFVALEWAWHIRLRTRVRNLNLRIQCSIFDSFRDNRVHDYDFFHVQIYDFFKFVASSGRSKLFLSQSIGTFLGQSIGMD